MTAFDPIRVTTLTNVWMVVARGRIIAGATDCVGVVVVVVVVVVDGGGVEANTSTDAGWGETYSSGSD
jgi:hypothetical protein